MRTQQRRNFGNRGIPGPLALISAAETAVAAASQEMPGTAYREASGRVKSYLI
jgi:hypothetical protein